MTLSIACNTCHGTSTGQYGGDSTCHRCSGQGSFDVDSEDAQWVEYCFEDSLHHETGDTFEGTYCAKCLRPMATDDLKGNEDSHPMHEKCEAQGRTQ